VKGTTRLVGVIGDPVAHSLSPRIHNAAFRSLKLDWLYVPLRVKKENMEAALKGLYSLGFRGANVTVPHKETVVPFLAELSREAAHIAAVNTIRIEPDGRMIGENTDWKGFLNHLEDVNFQAKGCKALILGSGGSARAVGYGLARRAARITICSRNERAAESLAGDLGKFVPPDVPSPRAILSLGKLDEEIELLVNTTPLGMSPDSESSPWPENIDFPECKLVYDLVYSPQITRFMKQARVRGVTAVNGLGMLVYQAAIAFEMWTGVSAPVEVMKQAVQTC